MAQAVLNNLNVWSTSGALNALQTLITYPGLSSDMLAAAQKLFFDISVCEKVILNYFFHSVKK